MGFKPQASSYCHLGSLVLRVLLLSLQLLSPQASLPGSDGSRQDSWQQPLSGLAWVVGQVTPSQLPPCFPLTKCCESQRVLGWLQPCDGGSSSHSDLTPCCSCQHSHECLLLSISSWTCEKFACLWGHKWRMLRGGWPGMDGSLAVPPSPPTGFSWGRGAAGGLAAPEARGFTICICSEVGFSSLNGQHWSSKPYHPFLTSFLYSNFHFLLF